MRRAPIAVAAASLMLAWSVSAPAAAAYTGPNAVEVPYLGETTVDVAAGWTIVDCAPVLAATPLVVACDTEGFTLRSDSYDRDFEPVTVPTRLTNGRTTLDVDYVVALAPPEPPTIGLTRYAYPTRAGSTLLVPISDLAVECRMCAEGGAMRVEGVEPAGAGTAHATSTHLVVRPTEGYAGDLDVALGFADTYGFWSASQTVSIPIVETQGDRVLAASVARPLEPGAVVSLSLASFVDASGRDVEVLGCGAAIHGTVICSADGNVQYVPFEDAVVDQFSYHVIVDGAQATGSVTLSSADSGVATEGLVSAARAAGDPDQGTPTPIVPRVPPSDEGDGDDGGGIFAPLVATLDRVGAR